MAVKSLVQSLKSKIRRLVQAPRPLRTQLLLLTLASALPITLFSGVLLWRFHAQERAQFEERVQQTALDLAADVDRELISIAVTLNTLATSPLLLQGQFAAFHAQARQAIAQKPLAVLLADPSGQQLLNTRTEFGDPLPLIADLDTLAKTIALRKLQVSNLFVGGISGRPQINVHVPILRNGEIVYDLLMAFEPTLIRDISLQQNLPKDWVRGVVDGNGRVIARTEQHERYVNTMLSDAASLHRQRQSVIETVNVSGKPVLRAVAPIKTADWIVAATVDRSAVTAATTQAIIALVVAGSVLIGLGAFIANALSLNLSAEIKNLTDAANRLDQGGSISMAPGLVTEVNDVKRSVVAAAQRTVKHEAERDLFARELSHRVKNSFAVLQSILNATLRTTSNPAAFAENFRGRLHSMAAAQDILTSSEWQNADLETLARGQLAAYLNPSSPRIRITGERVLLPATLAVPIGLVLHELGTNAAKHGALSVPRGYVTLSWKSTNGTEDRRVQLEWREHNGPPVVAPVRRGFGSTLIERGLADAEVDRRFEPTGVVCVITIKLQ